MIRILASLTVIMFLGLTAIAFAAPQQLYGKSIVVTWSEDRQQKSPDEVQVNSVGAFAEFDVYVSDQGRAFSRIKFFVANKRGKLRSGSKDAVAGEGSARNINFHGETMTAGMPRGGGGALQIIVNFEAGFQGCGARVIVGKSNGAESIKAVSIINGKRVDIYSAKTSGESCHIQNGNIFGTSSN